MDTHLAGTGVSTIDVHLNAVCLVVYCWRSRVLAEGTPMRSLLALFAITLAACADNAPDTSALVRDSAGVKIVEYQASTIFTPDLPRRQRLEHGTR